jgi:hypothetical protein
MKRLPLNVVSDILWSYQRKAVVERSRNKSGAKRKRDDAAVFDRFGRLTGRISPGVHPNASAYRRYRVDGRTLNHKIMDATLDRAAVMQAARALGMKGPGNAVFFDTEDETSILIDCAFYECKTKGKNAIVRYQEEIGGETKIERELLAAMVASSTSLFRIESVSRRTSSLSLVDLVNQNLVITLMDLSLSETGAVNYLIFFRPITLASFSMTSGVAFVFPGHLESKLLAHWRELEAPGSHTKRQPPLSTSLRRYAAFFKLSKRVGVETRLEDVGAK